MQVDSPEKIRSIAVAGHNDTGKTTLVSAMLYAGGVVNRLGKVEEGNATTDFDQEEIDRGISIGLGTCFVPWRAHKINLVDCPGYNIFLTETRAGLRAADGVLLCVSGVAGVEVTTERVWDYARQFDLPVVVNLAKMDRERADFERAFRATQEAFGREVVAVQLPIGKEAGFEGVVDLVRGKAYRFSRDGNGHAQEIDTPDEMGDRVSSWQEKLVEAVAETDDELMEQYFDRGTLESEEVEAGLRRAVHSRRIIPVVLSSGLHGIGIASVLDAIIDLLPSPTARPFPAQTIGGEPQEVGANADGPASALIFKTLSDPFSGKVSLFRVAGGTVKSDSPIWNSRLEESERLGQLMVMQGKQGTGVPQLVAGDLGAVAKLKNAKTGDTLCAKDQPVRLAWFDLPEPAISYAIVPRSKGDEEKIGEALHRLMEEDLTLDAGRDQETGDFLVSGTGELHVEINVSKLKKRFQVEVDLQPPKVPYRETILKPAEGHGRHKKQTGGRGQFADCKIKIEPLPRGEDFEFVDEIFGGSIPQQFRPAVEKGIREAREQGFLAGYRVVDFRVRLLDGQFHEVDSSEIAFKIAGSLAFKDAMERARPTVLEPMMKVEVTTGEEFTGDIMSDLSQRRGRPQGMDSRDGTQVISALVPMAEMLTYAPALRAMTQGRASFHMEFSHYEEMPKQVQEKLVAEAQKRRQERS